MSDMAELLRLAKAGRRAEKRKKAVEGCLTRLLLVIFLAFVDGLMLMLAVGFAHRHWLPQLPTLGYWPAVVLVALMRGVFSHIPPMKEKES